MGYVEEVVKYKGIALWMIVAQTGGMIPEL
jgi:hypothetical protein